MRRLVFVILPLLSAGCFMLFFKKKPIETSHQAVKRETSLVSAIQRKIRSAKDLKAFEQAPDIPAESRSYFNKRIKSNRQAAWIYTNLKSKLSDTFEGRLIAAYGSQVVVRDGSQENAEFFSHLMAKLIAESDAVAEELRERGQALREDPFQHQVLINLVADLKLPSYEKASLMGPALAQRFEVDEHGNISEKSTAVTIALIQMRKAGLNIQDVRPFIERGIELNEADPEALQEFLVRVNTYFPDWESAYFPLKIYPGRS